MVGKVSAVLVGLACLFVGLTILSQKEIMPLQPQWLLRKSPAKTGALNQYLYRMEDRNPFELWPCSDQAHRHLLYKDYGPSACMGCVHCIDNSRPSFWWNFPTTEDFFYEFKITRTYETENISEEDLILHYRSCPLIPHDGSKDVVYTVGQSVMGDTYIIGHPGMSLGEGTFGVSSTYRWAVRAVPCSLPDRPSPWLFSNPQDAPLNNTDRLLKDSNGTIAGDAFAIPASFVDQYEDGGYSFVGAVTDSRAMVIANTPHLLDTYCIRYAAGEDQYIETPVQTMVSGVLRSSLTGLTSSTQYWYQLNWTKNGVSYSSPVQTFRTQRAEREPFRFLLVSDLHLASAVWLRQSPYPAIPYLQDEAADFVVYLGDLLHLDEDQKYFYQDMVDGAYMESLDFFQELKIPVLGFAVGNHDAMGSYARDSHPGMFDSDDPRVNLSGNGRLKYLPYYDHGVADQLDANGQADFKSFYSWTWGDALFVILDPFVYTRGTSTDCGENNIATLGEVQSQWFKDLMVQSHAKYIFVMMHHHLGGFDFEPDWAGRCLHLGGAASIARGRNHEEWLDALLAKADAGASPMVFLAHSHVFASETYRGIPVVTIPSLTLPLNASNEELYPEGHAVRTCRDYWSGTINSIKKDGKNYVIGYDNKENEENISEWISNITKRYTAKIVRQQTLKVDGWQVDHENKTITIEGTPQPGFTPPSKETPWEVGDRIMKAYNETGYVVADVNPDGATITLKDISGREVSIPSP